MYCNICSSDYDFINFLNTFITENELLVYDPINERWVKHIDERPNIESSFIYDIAAYKTENTKKKPTHFERFLSVHKYSETDSKIYCGVISCVNDDEFTQKMLLKLKRKASENFNKGMKWRDEKLNTKTQQIIEELFLVKIPRTR
jgi:hypothetical protein